jgi:hypothetical protein
LIKSSIVFILYHLKVDTKTKYRIRLRVHLHAWVLVILEGAAQNFIFVGLQAEILHYGDDA